MPGVGAKVQERERFGIAVGFGFGLNLPLERCLTSDDIERNDRDESRR
jgi:hypothetical protein